MLKVLVAILLLFSVAPAFGQDGEWIQLRTVYSESVSGTEYANECDSECANLVPLDLWVGGLPPAIFFELPPIESTDTFRYFEATLLQDSGVEIDAFTTNELNLQSLWCLKQGDNYESDGYLSAIPRRRFWGARDFVYATPRKEFAAYIGVIRQWRNDRNNINGTGLAGIDCAAIFVDTTGGHKSLGVSVGDKTGTTSVLWYNVLGESVGALSAVRDGMYFSRNSVAIKVHNRIYVRR